MTHLNPAAADDVHYATDPRIRHLVEAAWRMRSGGSRMDWLCLGKDNPKALIREAREWVRAAVAAGILPPPQDNPAWTNAAWKAANADDTIPLSGVEVRDPCPHCGDRQLIPRSLMAEHVARLHPGSEAGA